MHFFFFIISHLDITEPTLTSVATQLRAHRRLPGRSGTAAVQGMGGADAKEGTRKEKDLGGAWFF